MKVLVTGATGMIGRALVEHLSHHDVMLLTTSFDDRSPRPDIPFSRVDLRDFDGVTKLCAGMDVVVQVAGIKGSVLMTQRKPATFLAPLLQMNTNVFEACRITKVGRVIYTSSIGVYSPGSYLSETDLDWSKEPMDTHPGWAKRLGELQLEAMKQENPDFSYAIVRPSNVYGPGDNFNPRTAMVIGALLGRACRGENPIKVQGSGNAVRDFVYSADVADAIARLVFSEFTGDLNIAAGKGITIRELASKISGVTGINVSFDDPTADEGFNERVLGIKKAKAVLGWCPQTSIDDGLRTTWQWLAEYDHDQVGRLDYFAD